MKISVKLITYYDAGTGLFPIKIRISDKKKETWEIIDHVSKAHWNASAGRVRATHPNAININKKIISRCLELEAIKGDYHSQNFYYWFQKKIDQLQLKFDKKKRGYHHLKKMKSVKKRLGEFASALPLNKLNYAFLSDFADHMRKKGNEENYISDTIMRIRSIVTIAMKSGAIPIQKNPFNQWKIKFEPTNAMRLTIDEIKELEKADGSEKELLARDMWLFSFYTGGMRWGDMCRAKKEMLQSDSFIYTINKSRYTANRTDVDVPVNESLRKIISKQKSKTAYIFDLKIDWSNEEQQIDSKGSMYRPHLKSICKRISIPEITYHKSRNSVADLAAEMGLTTKELQGIYGHARESTTAIYQKKFNKKQSHAAMKKLFGE